MRVRWVILLLGASLLLLSGCSSFIDQDQLSALPQNELVLEPGHSVGQTFVARHGGLNAVELTLTPQPDARGSLLMHLRTSPLDISDTLTATVPIAEAGANSLYRFTFPPIQQSHSQYYYASIELIGSGRVSVPIGQEGTYQDGSLYQDNKTQDAQTVFRLSYDVPALVTDLLLMVASWAAYGLAALVILFLSGYWIIRTYVNRAGADFTTSLILSVLSILSAFMVLLVWANVLNIRFSAWSIRAIIGASALAGLALFMVDRNQWRKREYWLGSTPLATLVLWAVVLVSIGVRLFAGRSMIVLPGADAYHHTLIAQLFAEQGGIPHTYEPYAPLTSFSYHFGFHSIVALFRWLFGTPLLATTNSVVLVLNGAIAAVAALVAEQITGNRRAGVITATILGLVLVSPFCLLIWSRFTQTAGLFFLAGALWAVIARPKQTGWLLLPLLIAGMVLSHYRVALYWGLFAGILGLASLLRRDWPEIRNLVVLGIISFVFTGPWLIHIAWVQLDLQHLRTAYPVIEGFSTLERLGEPVQNFNTNLYMAILAILLTIAAWFAKRRTPMWRLLLIWCIALVIGASVFPLTGSSLWDLKSTVLSLAIPIALLIGLGGSIIWDALDGYRRILGRAVLTIALLAGIFMGAPNFPGLLRTGGTFIRPGDLVTMKWIESNTPPNSLFLTNGMQFDWSPGWVVGIDIGYWIPLLSHRATTLPPMIYPREWSNRAEVASRLESYYQIPTNRASGVETMGQLLAAHHIDYVITPPWPAILAMQELAGDSHMREVYRQDSIRLFQVLP